MSVATAPAAAAVSPEMLVTEARHFKEEFAAAREAVGRVIVGQERTIEAALTAIFCGGNVLLEGVPGLGKTELVKALSRVLDLDFRRIQFTPDLMPADIIGTSVMSTDEHGQYRFEFRKGPIFTQLLLADEINRASPKTQSALLETMQEHSVTTSGSSYQLKEPFFVLATQNPIEQEGTYPLPEAQLDRFMFEILVQYPSEEEEFEIVRQTTVNTIPSVEKVLGYEEWLELQSLVRRVPVADSVIRYAMQFARLTRKQDGATSDAKVPDFVKQYVSWGAGPRASQYLILGAKARAILHGRPYAGIEDVQSVAAPVLRHRILTNFNAEAEGVRPDDIVKKLIDLIPPDGTVSRVLPKVFKTA